MPLYRTMVGPQSWPGTVHKISPHRNSIPEPSCSQSVAVPSQLSRPSDKWVPSCKRKYCLQLDCSLKERKSKPSKNLSPLARLHGVITQTTTTQTIIAVITTDVSSQDSLHEHGPSRQVLLNNAWLFSLTAQNIMLLSEGGDNGFLRIFAKYDVVFLLECWEKHACWNVSKNYHLTLLNIQDDQIT